MSGGTAADEVLVERRGHVAIVTLNRPEKLNAVTQTMAIALGGALHDLDEDSEIRAIVLTGGGRAFCAGADLGARLGGQRPYSPDHLEWGFAGMTRHAISTPIIAAVNGLAYGGGAEIAFSCDLIVASEHSQFCLPEVKRGMIPAGGGLIYLPVAVGRPRAMELALLGEPITAALAAEWGMINRVTSADDLMAVSLDLADRIAANAPLAVQASKRVVRRQVGESSELDLAWDINEKESLVRKSDDALEGTRAFLEKRAPSWKGR
jgi:crotonobetainyl-CoA hydratase